MVEGFVKCCMPVIPVELGNQGGSAMYAAPAESCISSKVLLGYTIM